MERKSIVKGQRWRIRLHGTFTTVRVLDTRIISGYRGRMAWRCDAVNEATGRTIIIRSPMKLRRLMCGVEKCPKVNPCSEHEAFDRNLPATITDGGAC